MTTPGINIPSDNDLRNSPAPQTWPCRMPAYAYTELCPVPNLRAPRYEEPSAVCKDCPKAKWHNCYGCMVYGCDMSTCIMDKGDE